MLEGSDVDPLERVLLDACFDRGAGEAIADDPRAFVVSRGMTGDDADAVAEGPARLAVYRSLVQNGIKGVVGKVLPRTRARLEAASPGRFGADLAAFLDTLGPRTHYLRDVPAELVDWTLPRWRSDPSVPPDVVDLALFEITAFAIASAPEDSSTPHAPVALDRPLRFAAAVRLVHFAHRIHEAPEDDPGAPALLGAIDLLGYRRTDYAAAWLELSPFAASITSTLLAGALLGDAVARACAAHRTDPSTVAPDVARLLADLAAERIIVGAG